MISMGPRMPPKAASTNEDKRSKSGDQCGATSKPEAARAKDSLGYHRSATTAARDKGRQSQKEFLHLDFLEQADQDKPGASRRQPKRMTSIKQKG